MQDGNAKQLISERVKNATTILVTVGANPSVDDLSAALGLTLLLNKMDKHATAVFSGAVPPAITFLEPDKTFENTVDSLRDFIIALDKEKADRLRYKVEDDVVRIFITPYRTTITDKDLQFSQGDFNVELIIALGVEKREDLDTAITAHGRILHDAVVVTMNAGGKTSSLGAIDWSDPNASSLCEMLVSISESFGSGLLDQQIANAFLTGIVAATERFSNQRTSPKVMTMAAQLMAAGANQQLIATKLEEAHAIPSRSSDGTQPLQEGASKKLAAAPVASDGTLQVAHDGAAEKTASATKAATNLAETAEEEHLAKHLDLATPPTIAPIQAALAEDTAKAQKDAEEAGGPSWRGRRIEPPTLGGTLSATAEEALQEKLTAEEEDKNHRILSHDQTTVPTQQQPSFNAFEQEDEEAKADKGYLVTPPKLPPVASEPPKEVPASPTPVVPAPAVASEPVTKHEPTLAELEAEAHAHAAQVAAPVADAKDSLDQARAAVTDALNSAPFNPAGNPLEASGATPLPSIDHLETIEPPAATPATPAPEFTLPPLPDMSKLPPLAPVTDAAGQPLLPPDLTLPAAPAPAPSNDPGQFKIPGQP